MSQHQTDAFTSHLGMDKGCHLRIQRIHQLFWSLNNGDLNSQIMQVLGKLQPDEASSGQNGGFGFFFFHKFMDTQSVLHRAQGKESVCTCAGQFRLCGLRPR